jgi:hypothetical protein
MLYLLSPIVPGLLLSTSLWLFITGLSFGLSRIGVHSNGIMILILLTAGTGYLLLISKLFKIREYTYLRKLIGELLSNKRIKKA